MESVSSFLGTTLDYDLADQICCDNHVFAEPSGYQTQSQVNLFRRLDDSEGAENIFYDSVCGIPLFIAPRGRTFDEFEDESIRHGWPSFRPEEMISENIKIYSNGRMESKCGTHLGHNLPEGGVDRYCIDLVCIAGTPTSDMDHGVDDDSVIMANEFDATTYESSAEDWSGKIPYYKRRIVMVSVVSGVLLLVAVYCVYSAHKTKRRNLDKQKELSDPNSDKNIAYGRPNERSGMMEQVVIT